LELRHRGNDNGRACTSRNQSRSSRATHVQGQVTLRHSRNHSISTRDKYAGRPKKWVRGPNRQLPPRLSHLFSFSISTIYHPPTPLCLSVLLHATEIKGVLNERVSQTCAVAIRSQPPKPASLRDAGFAAPCGGAGMLGCGFSCARVCLFAGCDCDGLIVIDCFSFARVWLCEDL